jgi:hypothetical protein
MSDIFNEYRDPILFIPNDTLQEIDEVITVMNNKAILSQIPDEFSKVKIPNYSEIQSGTPTEYQFRVDYTTGQLVFNENVVEKTNLEVNFFGRGVILFPASRISLVDKDNKFTHVDVEGALYDLKSRQEAIEIEAGSGNTAIDAALYDSIRDKTFATLSARLDQDSIDLIRSKSFVETGLTATKNGTTASQLDVVTGNAIMYQNPSIYSEYSPVATNFTTTTASTIYYLDFNADGTWSWGTSHSTNVNHIPIAEVTTDTNGDIASVTDKRHVNHGRAKEFYKATSFPTVAVPDSFIVSLTADYTHTDGITYKKGNTYMYNAELGKWINFAGRNDSTQTATIPHGLSIIETDQKTGVEVKADGRTLVNHMGWQGDFRSQFNRWNSSLVIDTATYKFGTSSGKIDNSAGTTTKTSRNQQAMYLSGKYILVGLWVKSASGTPTIDLYLVGKNADGTDSGFTRTVYSTVDSTWKFYYKKVDLTANTSPYFISELQVDTFGTASDVVNFDGMITYELTQAQYNEIDILTSDEVVEKYGYVDSVKHIQNPVFTSYGKNLLPSFDKWTLHADHTIISPYELNESNADGTSKESYVFISALENTEYTISVGNNTGNRLIVEFRDKNDTTLSTPNYANGGTFTTPSGTVRMKIRWYSVSLSGSLTLKNPQLELGSTATTFEAQNKTYLYGAYDSNENPISLGSNLDGSVADKLYNDNGWKVLKRWEKDKVLDGSLAWSFSTDRTGYKIVYTSSILNPLLSSNNSLQKSVKYDGKILFNKGRVVTDITDFDQYLFRDDSGYYISISDTDSGWTDAMTPTANMIKGYFNGWKYTGDGTTHTWVSIVDGSASPTQTEAYVSANVASDFTPYELSYQLADSVVEPVTMEGDLTLIDGLNQVELSEGVIVRELANPTRETGTINDRYHINVTGFSNASDSKLKNRTEKIYKIYKNGKDDTHLWTIERGSNYTYGKERARIQTTDFDTTARYTVTYLVLDKHLFTANAIEAEGTYQTNLKTVVDKHTDQIADINTKQSQQDIWNDDVAVKGEGEVVQRSKGFVNVSVSASIEGSLNVTFSKAYASPPDIFVVTRNSSYVASTVGVTSTGFTIKARHIDGTSTTASVSCHWIAVGR